MQASIEMVSTPHFALAPPNSPWHEHLPLSGAASISGHFPMFEVPSVLRSLCLPQVEDRTVFSQHPLQLGCSYVMFHESKLTMQVFE